MKLIYLALAATLLASCGGNANAPQAPGHENTAPTPEQNTPKEPQSKELGSFVGMFVAEKINNGER